MKVFIHAGLPKTGSTTIQASLFASRELIRSNDILLPIFRKNMPGHHFITRLFSEGGDPGKQPIDPQPENIVEVKEQFIECLNEARLKDMDVVLSTEIFSNKSAAPSAQGVRKLIEARGGQLFVLAYVRPPLNHMPSAISQEVRAIGGELSIERRVFAHVDRAGRLRSSFGTENVEFRIFDRSVLTGGEIVVDLVEWIRRKGARMPDVATEAARNEAISAAACATLWSMKQKLPQDDPATDGEFKRIRNLVLTFDRSHPRAKLSLPEAWIEPLTGLVAEAWNDLLEDTVNPEAERERFRLSVFSPGAASHAFSKDELFMPHLDLAYISDVATFGLRSQEPPLKKAARRLKEAFGV